MEQNPIEPPQSTAQSEKKPSTLPSSGSVPWPGDPAWDLQRLWFYGSKPRRWIVQPLIAEGDQIILAGEPKSGKSLLASQLCLEIAKGPGPLKINMPGVSEIPGKKQQPLPIGYFKTLPKSLEDKSQRWVVLYVSFEMAPQIMWARADQQSNGLALALLNPPLAHGAKRGKEYQRDVYQPALAYYHLFELHGGRTLGINPAFKDVSAGRMKENEAIRDDWDQLLDSIKPDLIVFDSLSQLHFCDENSNLEMRDALQQLRKLCVVREGKKAEDGSDSHKRPIAHIIIHHTRKESGDQKYSRKDASEMRGASSIHAEADLAITITKRHANGDEISLSFSSRHSARLPDLRLRRHELNAVYSGILPPEPTALTISRQLFDIMERRELEVDEVMALYKKRFRKKPDEMLGRSSWEKVLKKLADLKALTKSGGVKNKPAKFQIAKSIKAKDWVQIVEAIYAKTKMDSRKPGKPA